MDKNISIYELGKLAQNGDEVAMLEIINRKNVCNLWPEMSLK